MHLKVTPLLASLAVIIFTIVSCKKSEPYERNAELIGYDPRMCPTPCCGGLQITIDNVPGPGGAQFFLVYEMPKDFTLGDNPKFPIPVKIDYNNDTTHCGKNYVDITRIEKR